MANFDVDLVIVFTTTSPSLSKQKTRDDTFKVEQQYSKLLKKLTEAGLRAVGRRGKQQDHLLIFLSCPQKLLAILAHRDRHVDFLSGLPMSQLPSTAEDFDFEPRTPADRLRLIYCYITSTASDGGLGIVPGSKDWDLVDSVMALHNHGFNEALIRSWATRQITSAKLEEIREQFGDSVALYFSFLSSYTRALIFPAFLGTVFYFLKSSYSPIYSMLLLLWSITFVEWWTIRERILSVRWGTRGSFKVEKHRAEHVPGFVWWKKDIRMVASIPIIILFASVLAALLTGIFVFEAFVTELYTGPGHKYISFSPTILVVVIVPRVLEIYQSSAVRFTNWENHAHQSAHDASLTIKTFTLSAIVAYLGLALSAFIYLPFGENVMTWVLEVFNGSEVFKQVWSWGREVAGDAKSAGTGVWMTDMSSARMKLKPSRLQDEMFAYTVTNQVIDTFTEIGLPYILRFIRNESSKKRPGHLYYRNASSEKKKHVVSEDQIAQQSLEKRGAESDTEGKEEREFLERVRSEVALPPYELFVDYSEMVTQFGYVALWSTIWPLAPVMALLNNYLEIRSDAFKITHHNRRPTPMRTDTIGPWLDSLSFLTWLAALTNSALVYLFRSGAAQNSISTPLSENIPVSPEMVKTILFFKAVSIALAASHGYIIIRGVVRHLLEKILWVGSKEFEENEMNSRAVKEQYLKSIGETQGQEIRVSAGSGEGMNGEEDGKAFWGYDEGLDEIRRAVKDA